MKEALRGSHWRGAKLVKDETKNFFPTELKKLVIHWKRCFEV
jgi:hypothetical protein